jgi:hypothetical protein
LESAVEVEDDETAAEATGVDEADGDEEAEVAGVEVLRRPTRVSAKEP